MIDRVDHAAQQGPRPVRCRGQSGFLNPACRPRRNRPVRLGPLQPVLASPGWSPEGGAAPGAVRPGGCSRRSPPPAAGARVGKRWTRQSVGGRPLASLPTRGYAGGCAITPVRCSPSSSSRRKGAYTARGASIAPTDPEHRQTQSPDRQAPSHPLRTPRSQGGRSPIRPANTSERAALQGRNHHVRFHGAGLLDPFGQKAIPSPARTSNQPPGFDRSWCGTPDRRAASAGGYRHPTHPPVR